MEENQHDPLGTSMRQEFDRLAALSPLRCIYKVPKRLREENKKAYTPQVVSIGPLHHDCEHLEAMEEHKMRYVQELLRRNEVSLESCIKKVRQKEVKLRNCYATQIEFTSDKFVRLVLVDALFLIELLLRHAFKDLQNKNDYIFGTPWMEIDLWSDLAMLENQLPFFILEDLWEGAVTSPYSILMHSYDSFWHRIYHNREVDLETLVKFCDPGLKVEHFVDIIRNLCLPVEKKSRGKLKSIPSTTQLHQAGVKFEVSSTHNLLDIHFADGVLQIPNLKIEDSTEITIRNLIAYEQCHYIEEAYICHYHVLVDGLVNTPKDVELLGKYGILNSMLGDNNQISTLINNLGNGVIVDRDYFYFASTCDGLNVYCETDWHKWKANLRQNYLNTPWAAISVGAAILLLMLTITQTICSIISIS